MAELEGDDNRGVGNAWVLNHLLTYPGTYEIPLRTMYTLNATTQHQQQCPPRPSPNTVPGNAFPRHSPTSAEFPANMATITAAAQLQANLVQHISQSPTQPTSLPPSFVTSFVRRCFPPELDKVDFPQALTALDYLKDLEVRRRRQVVAALDKLGIDQEDLSHREKLAQKYPGVLKWVMDIEDRERHVESLYTQVYLGLRRWTLINELSLTPFDKGNCLAMLNTLYPPINPNVATFVQPTAQLTSQVLVQQRNGFFKYISAVEKSGPSVLNNLMVDAKKKAHPNGWVTLRETLEKYIDLANSIIDECYEITGHAPSPTATTFNHTELEEAGRRKADSGISFGSSSSSNRNSGQSSKSNRSQKSHATRPSTSSSTSALSRSHSRQVSQDKPGSKEKDLPDLPNQDDDTTVTQRNAGSALERIARELRKMKSRNNVKEEPRPRTPSSAGLDVEESGRQTPTSVKEKSLKSKLSIRRMRSNTILSETNSVRSLNHYMGLVDVPAFNAEEMSKSRQKWETAQNKK